MIPQVFCLAVLVLSSIILAHHLSLVCVCVRATASDDDRYKMCKKHVCPQQVIMIVAAVKSSSG